MVRTSDIAECVKASVTWERRRDLPDLIEFADYWQSPAVTASLLVRRRASDARPSVESFPYPKGADGLRFFAVGDPLDELDLRARVAPVVQVVDEALGHEVVSYPLAHAAPAWRSGRPEATRRRLGSLARIEDADFRGLGMLDVSAYYPSVSVQLLGDLLVAIGANEGAATDLCNAVSRFTAAAGLAGLPIGPETSGLLGNVYMVPLDVELVKLGMPFYRLTDDVWIFPRGEQSWERAIARCDVVFSGLELRRAPDKTEFIAEPSKALMYVQDPAISVTQGWLDFDRNIALEGLQELLDVMEDEAWPSATRFRFAMRIASSLTDTHVADLLARRPELMEVDPAAAGRYLAVATRKSRRHLEPLMPHLERQSTQRTEAVQLHLIRSASVCGWGRAERVCLETIASDPRRPSLVRAWALRGSLKGDARLASAAVDLATDVESPFALRRAAALGIEELPATSRVKACDHVRWRCPDLIPSARFVERSTK